jgi:hypothetical protein
LSIICSGINEVFGWVLYIGATVGTIGTIIAAVYTANPIYFMDLLHWPISFTMTYLAPTTIGLLSQFLFGQFLAGMIASHDDIPDICEVSCK